MDLNELPPELDYDFLDDQDANPSYCTQAVVGEQGQYMALCKFQNHKTQVIFTVVKLLLSNNVGSLKACA